MPMNNINFICGKTKDGDQITLDGFRVESFAVYTHVEGETFVDIYFKSGARETVYACEGDCPESIPDSLTDCMKALKKNPNLLAKLYPVHLIGCDNASDGEYFFDGNAVEYYIIDDMRELPAVELHFVSGNQVTVWSGLDEDLYPGESVETMVDDCICRYFNEKE